MKDRHSAFWFWVISGATIYVITRGGQGLIPCIETGSSLGGAKWDIIEHHDLR
jgi:hypothetical protein